MQAEGHSYHLAVHTIHPGPFFLLHDFWLTGKFQCNSNCDINCLKPWLEISCQMWYFRFENFLCNGESYSQVWHYSQWQKKINQIIPTWFIFYCHWFEFFFKHWFYLLISLFDRKSTVSDSKKEIMLGWFDLILLLHDLKITVKK